MVLLPLSWILQKTGMALKIGKNNLIMKLFSWFFPDYSGTGKGGECHRVVCFASSVLRCLRYSDIVTPDIFRNRFFGLFSLLNPHIEIMRATG